MKTITFYSFKGGVGRSLTLSNMALWLADEMKAKVCVIDFDLEAPGLPYKFEDLQNPTDQERLSRTEGIVEYIDEFNQTGIPPANFTRFYLPFTTQKGNPITLIPQGNLQQTDYWRKLFEINWQKLFE
ncbi:MAG: AAA family ATPase [Spirosomataceae bacterium]